MSRPTLSHARYLRSHESLSSSLHPPGAFSRPTTSGCWRMRAESTTRGICCPVPRVNATHPASILTPTARPQNITRDVSSSYAFISRFIRRQYSTKIQQPKKREASPERAFHWDSDYSGQRALLAFIEKHGNSFNTADAIRFLEQEYNISVDAAQLRWMHGWAALDPNFLLRPHSNRTGSPRQEPDYVESAESAARTLLGGASDMRDQWAEYKRSHSVGHVREVTPLLLLYWLRRRRSVAHEFLDVLIETGGDGVCWFQIRDALIFIGRRIRFTSPTTKAHTAIALEKQRYIGTFWRFWNSHTDRCGAMRQYLNAAMLREFLHQCPNFQVDRIYAELKEANIKLSPENWMRVAGTLALRLSLDKACNAFEFGISMSSKPHERLLAHTSSIILGTIQKAKNIWDADTRYRRIQDFMKLMDRHDVSLDTYHFETLILAAWDTGSPQTVVDCFKEMQSLSLEATVNTCRIVIKACLKSGRSLSVQAIARYAGRRLLQAKNAEGATFYLEYLSLFANPHFKSLKANSGFARMFLEKMFKYYSEIFSLRPLQKTGLIPAWIERSLPVQRDKTGLTTHPKALRELMSKTIACPPRGGIRGHAKWLFDRYRRLRKGVIQTKDRNLLIAMESPQVYVAFVSAFTKHPQLVRFMPDIVDDMHKLVDPETFHAVVGRPYKSPILAVRGWELMIHTLKRRKQYDAAKQTFTLSKQHGVRPTLSMLSGMLRVSTETQDASGLAEIIKLMVAHPDIGSSLGLNLKSTRRHETKFRSRDEPRGMIVKSIARLKTPEQLKEVLGAALWDSFAPASVRKGEASYGFSEDSEDYLEDWDNEPATWSPSRTHSDPGVSPSVMIQSPSSTANLVSEPPAITTATAIPDVLPDKAQPSSTDGSEEDYLEDWDDELPAQPRQSLEAAGANAHDPLDRHGHPGLSRIDESLQPATPALDPLPIDECEQSVTPPVVTASSAATAESNSIDRLSRDMHDLPPASPSRHLPLAQTQRTLITNSTEPARCSSDNGTGSDDIEAEAVDQIPVKDDSQERSRTADQVGVPTFRIRRHRSMVGSPVLRIRMGRGGKVGRRRRDWEWRSI